MTAAGVPAMLYGAAVCRPTAAALHAAKTATLRVLLHAQLRAVNCLLAVPWRAEPAVYVAIGPWDLLWRVVRDGAAGGDAVLDAQSRPPHAGGLLSAAATGRGSRALPLRGVARAAARLPARRRAPPLVGYLLSGPARIRGASPE